MRLFSTSVSCWVLVLAVSSLGACQRTSYPVNNSATVASQPPPSLLADSQVSALVTTAPPTAAPARRPPSAARFKLRQVGRPARRSRAKVAGSAPASRCPAASVRRLVRQPPARRAPLPPGELVHYRSRGIALLLAILSITYLPLSLHNFYLGYYGRGAAAIGLLALGIYLFAIGIAGGLFGGRLLAVGYVGITVLTGWFIWQLTDLIRIISRDLQPKDGQYKPRFF